MSKQRIYLDNNATTPLDPRLIQFVRENIARLQGNPSSMHQEGQQARRLISQARETVAAFLGVRPSEIIFTSSGTESVNMILRGLADVEGPGHLISSAVEHSSTLSTLKYLEKNGWEVDYLAPGRSGAITPQAVLEAIRPATKLIVLMAANNETGVRTHIEAIAALAKSRKILFAVDGVALLGKELFQIPEGVTAMAFSGHKIHALQGSGFAFIRAHAKLAPLLTGGGQEFGRRAGTENLLGIASLGYTVGLMQEDLENSVEQMRRLRDKFETLLREKIPGLMVNGEGPRVSNVSSLAFPGADGESLLIALDRAGIAASHGSACSSGALEPSHVLQNMGLESARVHSSVRFSLSRLTTEEEIEAAADIIAAHL
jgi:cysteine desulfurase